MNKWMLTGLAAATTCVAAIALALPPVVEPALGAPAVNFKATDMHGKPVELAQYRGKVVVLEWNNPGCPVVQRHYNSGNMQKTQAAAGAQGVVWLSINSGAPGKQGHLNGAQAQQFVAGAKAKVTDYLLDPGGQVGKAYGARTTPHMYIIDAQGKLVYRGAIDDKPNANLAETAGARNHVLAALSEIKAGKPVSVAETRPYGCSVKYAA